MSPRIYSCFSACFGVHQELKNHTKSFQAPCEKLNFKKNNFFVFDSGINPKEFKSGEKSNPNEWPRR